jgi:hypothetical protein
MQTQIQRVSLVLMFISALAVIGLALAPAANAVEPCCGITAIGKGGLVTAKVETTGKSFQFQVTDPALMKTLRVGQQIYADFGTQKVSVDGAAACCNIATKLR